jgi:hypothetical protein
LYVEYVCMVVDEYISSADLPERVSKCQ